MKNFSGLGSYLSALLIYLLTVSQASAINSTDKYGPSHINAHYGSSPSRMTIDVDPAFIEETRLKVSLTRTPIEINIPVFTEGIPSHNLTSIRDYWTSTYDWSKIQNELNSQFDHFTTTVGPLPSSFNYTHEIPLHFIHHRSPRPDAIPLLFIHGWPGSFLEVQKLLLPLTNPPASSPAFHVVAPSIPGYGFSPAPTAPGFGLIEAGAAFNDLMRQLGYTRYVVQGGDFGSHTARYMGAMFPESVASVLCNIWAAKPNDTDLARHKAGLTTPAENQFISFYEMSAPVTEAFWGIHAVVPLQMGILLGDSPVGNVVWPYFGMRNLVPGYEWGLEELITWGMMLYIPGPYGSVRMYTEIAKEGTLDYAFPFVHVPVGVLQYYGDAGYGVPRSWCERTGNVTYFVEKPVDVRGGHFPAHVNPEDLVSEIRAFWGSEVGGW
ncbi:alpha/beta-hydrolase [Periconia macrospinosa]|uniref:Alpha/beta-hydrolase n=1 Tax=Periconia macrospinosa TaxID=97972 RepID=A0A2V1E4I0_9PLEO|nr:alpha/beta-hydrolase [Periconia macrospinosa]